LLRNPRSFPPYAQRQRESERDTFSEPGKAHGRRERRTLTSSIALNNHLDWPGVKQVCRVVRERTKHGQTTTETAYYVTSLSRRRADAKKLSTLIRDHWGAIENGVHWVRDVVLNEDRCTIFRGRSPQNWATVRNAALNFLRYLKTDNLAAKLRNFAWNSHRLFAMLGYVK